MDVSFADVLLGVALALWLVVSGADRRRALGLAVQRLLSYDPFGLIPVWPGPRYPGVGSRVLIHAERHRVSAPWKAGFDKHPATSTSQRNARVFAEVNRVFLSS